MFFALYHHFHQISEIPPIGPPSPPYRCYNPTVIIESPNSRTTPLLIDVEIQHSESSDSAKNEKWGHHDEELVEYGEDSNLNRKPLTFQPMHVLKEGYAFFRTKEGLKILSQETVNKFKTFEMDVYPKQKILGNRSDCLDITFFKDLMNRLTIDLTEDLGGTVTLEDQHTGRSGDKVSLTKEQFVAVRDNFDCYRRHPLPKHLVDTPAKYFLLLGSPLVWLVNKPDLSYLERMLLYMTTPSSPWNDIWMEEEEMKRYLPRLNMLEYALSIQYPNLYIMSERFTDFMSAQKFREQFAVPSFLPLSPLAFLSFSYEEKRSSPPSGILILDDLRIIPEKRLQSCYLIAYDEKKARKLRELCSMVSNLNLVKKLQEGKESFKYPP